MNRILLLIIASSLFLTSCASSDLDCNSDMVKKTVKDLLLESELQNGGDFSSMYNISRNDVEKLFEEVIKISSVRTVAKNDELKSCDCKATLIFHINEEMKNDIKKINENGFARMLMNGLVDEKGIEIIYNIQETADGEIYVETQEIENLDVNVTIYGLAYKQYMAKDNKQIGENDNTKENIEPDNSEIDEYVENISQEEKDLNKELKNKEQFKENVEYVVALKDYIINNWEKAKQNNSEIGKIFIENNELRIEYDTGSFMSVYDFNDITITQKEGSKVLIAITNEGGGAGGNVGIFEDYLITKIGENNFDIKEIENN